MELVLGRRQTAGACLPLPPELGAEHQLWAHARRRPGCSACRIRGFSLKKYKKCQQPVNHEKSRTEVALSYSFATASLEFTFWLPAQGLRHSESKFWLPVLHSTGVW